MSSLCQVSVFKWVRVARRRRGIGEIGHGNTRGVLLHPILAVDAESGGCLGLLNGEIWTRKGRCTVSHDLRELSDKESAGSLRNSQPSRCWPRRPW